MRKLLLFFGITLIILTADAQSNLLIFNTSGEIFLKRGKNLISMPIGELFLEEDYLIIINGSATIINRENKRISLNESKNYNYKEISEMMGKAEASITNRYFSYVWEKINKSKKDVNLPGGVIRSYEILYEDEYKVYNAISIPVDGARLLCERIYFVFDKEDDYKLSIYSEELKLIKKYKSNNNEIILNINEINNAEPGLYYWEINPKIDEIGNRRSFIIPDEETFNKLKEEYNKTINDFESFDNTISSLLISEYFEQNQIFLNQFNPQTPFQIFFQRHPYLIQYF